MGKLHYVLFWINMSPFFKIFGKKIMICIVIFEQSTAIKLKKGDKSGKFKVILRASLKKFIQMFENHS